MIPSVSNNVHVTEHEAFQPTLITTPGGKTMLVETDVDFRPGDFTAITV